MEYINKFTKLLVLVIIILIIAMSIFHMGGLETLQYVGGVQNSIEPLSDDWSYQVNGEGEILQTNLPASLPLRDDAKTLVLYNTLPLNIKGGDALRLLTLSGWFDIYVDGELRASYGNHEITDKYWYENASSIMLVKFNDDDAGKVIEIHTGSISAHHLSMQQEPNIGEHRDFLMADITKYFGMNILNVILCIISIFLLVIWLIFKIKKHNIKEIPLAVLFLLVMIAYYNVSNVLFIELLSYAPTYPSVNDYLYYTLNIILPIIAYTIVLPFVKDYKNRLFFISISAHIAIFVLGIIVQLIPFMDYEVIEKTLMFQTCINYVWILCTIIKLPLEKTDKYFVYPVFICILTYALDYAKYMCNLGWLPRSIELFLQVDSPFMIFIPFGMIVYICMILIGINKIVNRRESQLICDAQASKLRAILAENEFQNSMENINEARKIRHDIEHHFTVISGYISEGKAKETLQYIDSVKSLIPKGALFTENIILNSFIEKNRILCEQHDITFSFDIQADENCIKDKTALGIIIGNGLKNAFESACTANEDKKFINISIKQIHDNLAIIIKNGFNHHINKNYKSTKSKDGGFGLANIQDTINRCGGYCEYSFENYIFTLQVVLYIS